MLPAQAGVCLVCRGWSGTAPRCSSCEKIRRFVGRDFPVILPLALAVNGKPLALALSRYKKLAIPKSVRFAARSDLLGLIDLMADRHESCLRQATGVAHFDRITFVPGTRDRNGFDPTFDLLQASAWSRSRCERTLKFVPGHDAPNKFDPERFVLHADVERQSVILVDDTLTTGSNVLSAAYALLDGGASTVAVAVLGRHFRPDFQRCQLYLNEAEVIPFDAAKCALCDPHVSPVSLSAHTLVPAQRPSAVEEVSDPWVKPPF